MTAFRNATIGLLLFVLVASHSAWARDVRLSRSLLSSSSVSSHSLFGRLPLQSESDMKDFNLVMTLKADSEETVNGYLDAIAETFENVPETCREFIPFETKRSGLSRPRATEEGAGSGGDDPNIEINPSSVEGEFLLDITFQLESSMWDQVSKLFEESVKFETCFLVAMADAFDGGVSLVSGSLEVNGVASKAVSYEVKFDITATTLDEAKALGDDIKTEVAKAAGVEESSVSVAIVESSGRRRLLASYSVIVTIVGDSATIGDVADLLESSAGQQALLTALDAAGIVVDSESLAVNTSASNSAAALKATAFVTALAAALAISAL